MHWEVEVSDEFVDWYNSLAGDERKSVAVAVEALELAGPGLGRPLVDTLKGSEYANLKELRVQHKGRPLRVLFVFGEPAVDQMFGKFVLRSVDVGCG